MTLCMFSFRERVSYLLDLKSQTSTKASKSINFDLMDEEKG